MAEKVTNHIVEAMNIMLLNGLDRWIYNPYSHEEIAKLNTVFDVAEMAGLKFVFEVKKEAIFKTEDDDFTRILPSELSIYGKEESNSYFFEVPSSLENQSSDHYVLYASLATGEPRLIFHHKNHGIIGRFEPSDLVSIKLQ